MAVQDKQRREDPQVVKFSETHTPEKLVIPLRLR
jgi:hypothetical protein